MDYDSQLQQDYSSPSSHHQLQAGGCSFLFLQTQPLASICTGFGNCHESAIWCWPQSCSFSAPDLLSCSINGTSHSCICSSLPPTVQLEDDLSTSTNPTSTPYSFLESAHNSTWQTHLEHTTTPISHPDNTTMSMWSSSTDNMDIRPHGLGLGQPSTSFSIGPENDGLPAGAIAAIVVVSLLVAVALIALSVWSVLKLKRKRKLEGRYCPAVEEQKSSANTLPPLPLPAPEGLI